MKINKFVPIIATSFLIIIFGIIFWFKIEKNNNPLSKKTTENQEYDFDIKYVSGQKIFNNINNTNYQIVDIRPVESYKREHIESSINYPISNFNQSEEIPLIIFPKNKKYIIVEDYETNEGKKIVEKLINNKYEVYYLKGGITEYRNEKFDLVSYGDINSPKDISKINPISSDELLERIGNGEIFDFLDVRRNEDYQEKHLESSVNIPLEELEKRKREIPIGKIVVVDNDPVRSFQASVRLYDMNTLGVYCFEENFFNLEDKIDKKIEDIDNNNKEEK